MPPSLDVVDYVEKDFLAAINNDLIAVVKFHEGTNGGFHSVPREVFCYIDYISVLRYGLPNSSTKAIRFIEKYLGSMNGRYKHFGKLLYEMWRHGTVHEFDPKALRHSSKKYSIGWQTNNDSGKEERACHLECFKVKGKSDTFLLNVNLFQLVDDLVQAIHVFAAELKRTEKRRAEAQRYYNEISKQLSVKDLSSKNKSVKLSLNLQITKAVKSQRLEIYNGSVVGGKC